MNPSGYYGRSRGYSCAALVRGRQGQPGCPIAGSADESGSFAKEGGRGYEPRPLKQRKPQGYPARHQAPAPAGRHQCAGASALIQDAIRTAFSCLRTNPQRALDTAETLLDSYSAQPSFFIQLVQLKARALFQLSRIDACIAFINSLEPGVQNGKGLMMAKARALQAKGCFNEALPLFRHLYVTHNLAYKDHKAHALGLGRHLQIMGGSDNLQQAQAILTRLRTRAAAGREHSPCDDKEIELALGRLLQTLGDANHLEQALAIYTRLRTRRAGGRINTPCDDKEIELTLGRHLQLMGGADNQNLALAIFTRLRSRRAGGRLNTPCDDKDIELALGRCHQLMGGTTNLEKALAIFSRLRSRMAAGRANTPCDDTDIELALGRCLQLVGSTTALEKALAIFTRLRIRAAGGRMHTPCDDKEIELALGRHLQIMGGPDNLQKALAIFTRLRSRAAGGRMNTPGDDKEIELALGRLLQIMGGADNQQQALAIFTRLRARHAGGRMNTACDDKNIELTLGRHLQLMGGSDNLEKALAIYTRLRTRAAGGLTNTPCNDKEIELALGRHFQLMGGADNMKKAMAIYTRLRTRAAGGKAHSPCNDKDIELTFATHLQLMGGADNLDLALAIYTRLRARAAGSVNTPCDDKDIELSLARILRLKGGQHNQEKAWAIYTRLRTRAAGGQENTPCDDKDIELNLAAFFTEMGIWSAFDELRLEARQFPGFESHLCLSVRCFHEILETATISGSHSRLLGKALKSASIAIEISGFMNASCISQLAHCIRVLSCWPQVLLENRGIHSKDVSKFVTAAKFLFAITREIAPYRQKQDKDRYWRAKEQKLLALLSQQGQQSRSDTLTNLGTVAGLNGAAFSPGLFEPARLQKQAAIASHSGGQLRCPDQRLNKRLSIAVRDLHRLPTPPAAGTEQEQGVSTL